MQTVAIEGNTRTELTKSSTKAIRREKGVPCVIYGGNEIVHFYAHENSFTKLLFTPEFKVAEITVDGTTYRTLVKDTQFHPVKDTLQHIDFIELVPGKKVKTEVPVKIVGSSPGVKVGGKLLQNIRKIKIMATPEALVDSMVVNISTLELGKSVRIKDLVASEGVEVLSTPAAPVATIEIPRALRSAMNEAAKAATTAVKKKK